MALWYDRVGSILDDRSQALVNPVNCVGVMGKGLALQFKGHYPKMFETYVQACTHGYVRLGEVSVYTIPLENRYIVNFPTKGHWKDRSTIEAIADGLQSLRGWVQDKGVTSIAIPPIGCGLGGLSWSDVKPLIVETLDPLENLIVHLYHPKEARDA